jgi:iron complex transport system ATP-binding protein
VVTIRLDSVSASLGRRPVLHDVTAEFTPGALVGIIGPNGAGKSTLARAMLALLPLDDGRVSIDGDDAAAMSRAALARRIAYLSQGQSLHWPLTVERLVGLGRLPHLGPLSRLAAVDVEAIEQAMAKTDVTSLCQRIATELSGGERARVLLARALAAGAPALIADEPLASLDPGHQIEVMELLAAEARSGALVIVVLHDLTMAARYCDRLLLLDRGRLIADGSSRTVLDADRLAEVYGIRAAIDFSGAQPFVVPLSRAIST